MRPFTPPQGSLRDEESTAEKDDLLLAIEDLPEIFERNLNSNDYTGSIYVDGNGNAYEPYSMGWRYLGMYIDCETSDYDGRRHLNSGSGSGSGDNSECSRKLLWAAYVDPRYRGGGIGEYQFYDVATDSWDDSSCTSNRCAKMDCHDPHTHFKLIGVYKETDGLYDWGEQLFKHHGYCQWDEDTYDVMAEMIEKWPQDGCQKLDYPDDYGNTLYKATKPLPEGNLTVGLYYNEECTQDSGLLWSDYIIIYYNALDANSYYYYYNYAAQGKTYASEWDSNIVTWNNALTTYKMCQPCRAYNLYPDESGSRSGSRDRRELDENDGEGDAEQSGYDCYDDAGYTNCNQCYKFQTHTDMETAVRADLSLASSQGTILEIRVGFMRHYGKGGFHSPTLYASQYITHAIAAVVGLVLLLGLVYKCRGWYKGRQKVLDYFGNAEPCGASCALVGLECNVSVKQQKPTATDPMAADFFRLPRLGADKNGDEQRRDKDETPRRMDWNDGQTEIGSSSGEESDTEQKSESSFAKNEYSGEEDQSEKKSASPIGLPWLFSMKTNKDSNRKSVQKKWEGASSMGYVEFPPENSSTSKEKLGSEQQVGYVHPETVSNIEGGNEEVELGTSYVAFPSETNVTPSNKEDHDVKHQMEYVNPDIDSNPKVEPGRGQQGVASNEVEVNSACKEEPNDSSGENTERTRKSRSKWSKLRFLQRPTHKEEPMSGASK